MAAHGARRLGPMIENLEHILGVELLCGAQGVEFRTPLCTSDALAQVVARLRQDVATLGEDRYLAPDLERAAKLIASGEIAELTGVSMPELAS